MKYDNPFPGMNPYLEHRHIWPDFHFSLVAGLANALGPRLPHNYRVDLKQRVEYEQPVGLPSPMPEDDGPIRVRMPRGIKALWLRVETVPDRELVTIVEVLSPTNKVPGRERNRYERKREVIVGSGANLVEIDLLRRWQPMPLETPPPASDYRILVCEGWQRPSALLYPFNVQQPIPPFALPLLPEDKPLQVDLGPIIDRMHHTARYGQVTRYQDPPPEPAFAPEVAEWVGERVAGFVAAG